MLELGYAAKSLGWDRIICFINSEYGTHDDLPFDLKTRRIIPYSVVDAEKSETRKIISNIIESTVKKLLEDNMLPVQNDEVKSNRKLLSSLLKRGIGKVWNYYYKREMDLLEDFTEENFVVITDAHFDMIETLRQYIDQEQYFLLHEMFDLIKNMRNGTEDMDGWEYARIFVERYFESLYVEYFSIMDEVSLENILIENVLNAYNALLNNTDKIEYTAARYSREGKLIFYSDKNYQEAYDREGNLLCKFELDDKGLITGWKKTDEYVGEYKDGSRHGNGTEYAKDLNYNRFKKREGLWRNNEFVEGRIYGAIIYKDEENKYSWEPDEQNLPQTKAWRYLRDMLEGEGSVECKNYYLADMILKNGEYELIEDTFKPICSHLGGDLDVFCHECEFE